MVVIEYPDGSKYEGDVEDGMKDGEGTLSYPDGGYYEGQWSEDMRCGYGVNKWANGCRYAGQWEDNKMHGDGKYTYPDGGQYKGEWENNVRCGQGVNTWANGEYYDGAWDENKREGHGIYVYNNEECKYVGDWSNDMRHGYGVNTWPTGDRYEGYWRNNMKHGQGTLYLANGTKLVGNWADNNFDKSSSGESKKVAKKFDAKNALQFKAMWTNGQPFTVLLMPRTTGCPYHELAREYVGTLNWHQAFFDSQNDRCYCSRCYEDSWENVLDAGNSKYVIPRGWVRLGLHVDQAMMQAQDIWNQWIVTFHGTTKVAAQSIVASRQFCMPGDVLVDGTKLAIRPGHIPGQVYIYTSPTIAYSSGPAYSPLYEFHSAENDAKYEAQFVLQCRQKPDTFKIGPETIGAGKVQICPHIPNSEIEYFTERRSSLIAYGLLVRFRSKNN
ncbi:unnamed protein product [Adineta ricciae]|uniref:Uncharacterized protein n=1 Tax=Adineta ricciae TaxID=249248 RepID=A0A813NMT4_ADIRI|nr:unnamed protein product [Adineta ricciae]CAF1100196.1 unnamed protein product [Adineta ricciae]